MSLRVRAYRPSVRATIVVIFGRFNEDLIALDPGRRFRRLSGYGEFITDKTVDMVAQQDGAFCLAVGGDEVIGDNRLDEEARLGVIPALPCRITELYVDPTHCRQGVGRRFMRAAERYIAGRGCDAIRVEVFAPSGPVRALRRARLHEA